ncbi:ER protein Pkr1-domain-containing protein [Suillus paluster]|uniref:ER protein Pkr1-domain-containing protein n=1 Tax=Suillus paluster TaxID=48578 RepID=UPI001B87D5FD|nr:ER protein Pkr1-domain-containing protein [Suillus paluster]KAG1724383.1 ER protein Pkr1-domain-containing protein [Suillus paluster]
MALGEESSFFSSILKPGSSLHPTFLLAVNAAFALLVFVFLWSAYLTKGNPHFFVLMGIQLALWVSVKWFVQELKKLPPASTMTSTEMSTEKKEQ